MSTGEVQDYAIRRFHGHAADARQLIAALQHGVEGRDVTAGHRLAAAQHPRDNVFTTIIPSIAAAVHQSVARIVIEPTSVATDADASTEPLPS